MAALKYQDIEGISNTEIFEGLSSTVLSHELDLNWILHMDIADEVLVMCPEERKAFRKTHGYNIVKKRMILKI